MKIFKENEILDEKEVRFFNICIYSKGKKVENGITEEYFDIFPKSLEHKALDKILSFIPKKEKHDHIWIVRTTGLGEAHLLNFMMDELKKKYKAKNPCFISHRAIYKEMFGMYSDIPFYFMNIPHNSYAPYLKKRDIKYKGKTFHIHHCTIEESLQWLKDHQDGDNSHAMELYKKCSHVSELSDNDITKPVFTDEIKKSVIEKVGDLNIDKFVFLIPEANGTDSLPEEFWIELTEKLEEKGYDIFVNKVNGKTSYGKSTKLNVAEASYLSSLAQSIVALRCGFTEVIGGVNPRKTMHVLYPTFRSFTAEQFYNVYSLKQYPFKSPISEYIIDNSEYSNVLEKILMEV